MSCNNREGRGRRSLQRRWLALSAVLALAAPLVAEEAGLQAAAAEKRPIAARDEITVTAARLETVEEEILRYPAHVTVLEESDVDAGDATTLQELLAFESGVTVYDQVGNGLVRTLDLRGFTAGTGVKVLLDGVPINDTRSNALALELVPVAGIGRIEIRRGSAADVVGGGAEAGVIRLETRRPVPGGTLRLALGEEETLELGGGFARRGAAGELSAGGRRRRTEGFRENGGGELEHLHARLARELAPGHQLALAAAHGAADLGAPGALTAAELAADRRAAPHNAADFGADRMTQAALNYGGRPAPRLSLAANLFARRRASDALTTGRAAPLFGGFDLGATGDTWGGTAEIAAVAGTRHTPVAGGEWLDGELAARGSFTPAADPGDRESAVLSSDNLAERRTGALYLQDTWRPGRRWSVVAGVRHDRDRVGYRERFPDPSYAAGRRFARSSARGGVSWAAPGGAVVWLARGEGFLPPTVEELFSFPLFGSNPGLEPESSTSWELGVKRGFGGALLDLTFFRVDTRNEIVFDPDSPLGLFGANVNAGEARRRGLEASYRGAWTTRIGLFANLTWTEAELTRGSARGRTLPLVPRTRLAVGLDWSATQRLALVVRGLYVGERVLDNDAANRLPPLAAYAVASLRLVFSGLAGRRASRAFIEVENLLDEEYASRGIAAFDFAAGVDDVFFTPAPPRRIAAGIDWSF